MRYDGHDLYDETIISVRGTFLRYYMYNVKHLIDVCTVINRWNKYLDYIENQRMHKIDEQERKDI